MDSDPQRLEARIVHVPAGLTALWWTCLWWQHFRQECTIGYGGAGVDCGSILCVTELGVDNGDQDLTASRPDHSLRFTSVLKSGLIFCSTFVRRVLYENVSSRE